MNILLVDDDNIFNFISEKTLMRMGIAQQIHKARNGQDALQLLNSYFQKELPVPDVILLDLYMPVMDGFQFLEAFGKLTHPGIDRIMVIIVTSSNNPDDRKRTAALGFKHYLNKPLHENDLRAILT